MNIAIVSAHGIGSDTPEVVRELARDHRVAVYTRSQDRSHDAGTAVEHLAAGPDVELSESDLLPYIPDFSAGLRRRWTRDRPDVIHAHSWSSGLAAIAGSNGLGVPVAQTFHGHTLAETSPPVRRLERAIGRQATSVIAACADEETELIRLGVPRRNISVVPAGVDIERFHRQGPAFPRDGRPRLLHVGHLGAGLAIRALAGVPEARLLIAGGDDPSLERLRMLAKERGLEDRVDLLGLVPHDTMPRLMRSADVVLSLPAVAPTGMAALEAMACGIPVIASATGAHLDSVVDGVTGFLLTPDHPADLAARIRELLSDPTMRTAVGYAAADRARSRYSVQRITTELLRVYERACA